MMNRQMDRLLNRQTDDGQMGKQKGIQKHIDEWTGGQTLIQNDKDFHYLDDSLIQKEQILLTSTPLAQEELAEDPKNWQPGSALALTSSISHCRGAEVNSAS